MSTYRPRQIPYASTTEMPWSPATDKILHKALFDYKLVINYAHTSIGGTRWLRKDIADIQRFGANLAFDIRALKTLAYRHQPSEEILNEKLDRVLEFAQDVIAMINERENLADGAVGAYKKDGGEGEGREEEYEGK
jgi:hypothetical protein